MATKIKKASVEKDTTRRGRPAKPGGLLDKVAFAKTLVKTKTRAVVVSALIKKFRGMSPLYAATVSQLARKAVGLSGHHRSMVEKTTKGTHIAKLPATPKAPVAKKEPVEREDDDI